VTFSAAPDESGKGYLARVALDGSVSRMLLEPPGDGGLASNASPAIARKVRGRPTPSWSPDGARIALTRDPGSILIVDADGSHPVRVPFEKPANGAVWEPAP
jgi:hypothetical protein